MLTRIPLEEHQFASLGILILSFTPFPSHFLAPQGWFLYITASNNTVLPCGLLSVASKMRMVLGICPENPCSRTAQICHLSVRELLIGFSTHEAQARSGCEEYITISLSSTR